MLIRLDPQSVYLCLHRVLSNTPFFYYIVLWGLFFSYFSAIRNPMAGIANWVYFG